LWGQQGRPSSKMEAVGTVHHAAGRRMNSLCFLAAKLSYNK